MRAIINVDLEGLRLSEVFGTMEDCGVKRGRHSRHLVKEWDTLAVAVEVPNYQEGFGTAHDTLREVARRLGQDCIAVYDLEECFGFLVGPCTERYQPFDAGLFRVV